jgi:hypothetical protein
MGREIEQISAEKVMGQREGGGLRSYYRLQNGTVGKKMGWKEKEIDSSLLAKKATYQFNWENTKYDLDNRTEVNLPRKWLLRKWLS